MAATKSEQFEHNENPADAGFLLSGDPTGVFATVHCTSTPVISSVYKHENSTALLRQVFFAYQVRVITNNLFYYRRNYPIKVIP